MDLRYATIASLSLFLFGCSSSSSGTEYSSGSADASKDSSPGDASVDWSDGSASDSDAWEDSAAESSVDSAPEAALDSAPEAALDSAPDVALDSQGADSQADGDVGATDGSTTELTVRLVAGSDAISSYLISASPAAWNMFSGDSVPLGRHFDTGHVSYYTAIRFENVQVPKGAKIASAKLSFYPTNEVDSSNNLWINIYAEKSENSKAFDPANYDVGRPDQRLRTSIFVDKWLVRCNDSCTSNTEYDCPQRKLDCWNRNTQFTVPKDLVGLVDEVVQLPGWKSGQAITILLINSATDQDGAKYQANRTITGFDKAKGADFAPALTLRYSM